MVALVCTLENRSNSFNAVRLAAAAAVVVSHSFALLHGEFTGEPLSSFTPYTLGQHAVNVFFVLSGVMVSRSWALNPHLGRFALARALRIYPGLIVCGVVTALLLGALGTAVPLTAYLSDRDTLLYPLKITLWFNQAGLDEVFAAGTKPGAVNASLWTVKYELAAYILYGLAAALGLIRHRTFVIVALVALTLAVIGLDLTGLGEARPGLVPPGRFFLSFTLGLTFYAYKDRLQLRWDVLASLALVAFASRGSAIEKPAFILFTGYGALLLGGLTLPVISNWTGRIDLSYGLYLYAWPIQQLLLHHWPSIPLPLHITLSLALSLGCAALSWPLVERPALNLKARAGHRSPTVPGEAVIQVGGQRVSAVAQPAI